MRYVESIPVYISVVRDGMWTINNTPDMYSATMWCKKLKSVFPVYLGSARDICLPSHRGPKPRTTSRYTWLLFRLHHRNETTHLPEAVFSPSHQVGNGVLGILDGYQVHPHPHLGLALTALHDVTWKNVRVWESLAKEMDSFSGFQGKTRTSDKKNHSLWVLNPVMPVTTNKGIAIKYENMKNVCNVP